MEGFHRALGLIRPKYFDLELFDITYVQCGEIQVEKKIDDRIEHFITWIHKHPNKKIVVGNCLSNPFNKSFSKSLNSLMTKRIMFLLLEIYFPFEITITTHKLIGFNRWEGYVEEDTPKWPSIHDQLMIHKYIYSKVAIHP
ncbi:uncharacterized protein LOC108834328 [Raphanus sativus]|uniref:Autophagy-related protein 101 n=1 Tax=Raphanus sativus TaxID=3726 RepID=A0A6J0LUW2_RAPSA|nr:uncharacterized protein LOC108834328 [Raphanus sativus]